MAIKKSFKEEMKKRLLGEKSRLEKELSRFAAPTGRAGDYATKFGEIGTAMDENASEVEEYTDNLALENTLERELKDVSDALARLEKGTYGICENCGEKMGVERLKAYPAARNCIKCN